VGLIIAEIIGFVVKDEWIKTYVVIMRSCKWPKPCQSLGYEMAIMMKDMPGIKSSTR
jgi:hypothetical protein